ncbi:MAG: DUF2971 domain-containing protein [Oscillospiraceae bacterium]|nr:DUF2971 domain-containing protein [Oscillospiraceae bacterium]
MNAPDRPKLFFKYKSTASDELLQRVLDILSDNKLFFPNRKQLNDPFENLAIPLHISGYAGSGMFLAADQELPFLEDVRNQYKLLSLSSTCFSPLMWAHYADEGKGLCLCFCSERSFRDAKAINYINSAETKDDYEITKDSEIEKRIQESFFLKHADWECEKEWRIVSKTDKTFFEYNSDELVAIIYGPNIEKSKKALVKKSLPLAVKQYRIHLGGQSGAIKLLHDDYEICYDMREPPFIGSIEDLLSDLYSYQAV